LRGHFNDRQPSETDTREERIEKLPEVFCYVDRKRRGVYEAVKSVCILARNPSLHPGDIRVVRAVDVPHLHHIKNSVVLPQTGDRDVSNMCSGGDLDGDDYLLIWDEELIPEEWNHPPMDFTAARPRTLDRLVTVNDMTDFFVDYMRSDKLAMIATRHLALADYVEDGVKDGRCKQLAQLHSLAVDYPKSGVPVSVPAHLKKVKWPHFMEKPKTNYISKKILGQLYDLVVKEDFSPEYTYPFDKRILEAFDHDEELLKKVEDIKCRYDDRIKKIMAQHDVNTEFEVWSAFVLKHNDDKKDYNFAEELGTLMEAVRTGSREECEREAGGRDPARLHPFVSAMYAVTARQTQEAITRLEERRKNKSKKANPAIDPKSMPLISFPWLFMQDLGKIACGGAHVRDIIQRVQGPQKRHHIRPAIADNEGQGEIETSGGVLPRGELLKAFDDQGQRIPMPKSGHSKGADEHIEMINRNIRGHAPDRPESGRDVKVKALGGYHEAVKQQIIDDTSITSKQTTSSDSMSTLATLRRDWKAETEFMSDGKALLWWADSNESDELLSAHGYEDLRELSQETSGSTGLLTQQSKLHLAAPPDTGVAPEVQDGSMAGLMQVHLDLQDDSDDGLSQGNKPERSLVME
jgi:RNA-dependent RNA polymerase